MKKAINILIILLISQLVLALLLGLRSNRLAVVEPDQRLLTFNRENLKQIRVSQRTDDKLEVLVLRKDEGKWVLPDHDDIPVSPSKIEDFLKNLSDLKAGWPAATTLIAARQFDLGSDNWQKQIEIVTDDEQPTKLLIGSSPSFKKVYARLDGENISHTLNFPSHELSIKMEDWFDRAIARVDRNKIRNITMGELAIINNDGDFTISDIPEGKELKKSDLSELITRLTDVTVQKVLGVKDQPEFNQKQPLLQYTIELQSGDALTYKISQIKDSESYVLKASNLPYYFAVPKPPVDQSKDVKPGDLLQDKKPAASPTIAQQEDQMDKEEEPSEKELSTENKE